MSLSSKVSGDGIKDGEEPLCLFRRFDALHWPLALPGRLMGVLGPVVKIAALAMSNIGKHEPFGGAVAPKLVGDYDSRFASSTAQEFPKEALRREPVASGLNENINHGSVLIHCTPEIMSETLDLQGDFIEVPLRSQLSLILRRSSSAKYGPNLSHHSRTVS